MECNNPIMQGDEYGIGFTIEQDNEGTLLDIANVDAIQFTVDTLVKYYKSDGTGEVSYIETSNQFQFPLSQEETFKFEGDIECQIRIKFKNGKIVGKKIGTLDLQYSSTEEEF